MHYQCVFFVCFSGVCECSDFTTGTTCERCLDGYYGNSLIGTRGDCQPCPCPGQTSCVQIAETGQVVCTNCPAGQTGDVNNLNKFVWMGSTLSNEMSRSKQSERLHTTAWYWKDGGCSALHLNLSWGRVTVTSSSVLSHLFIYFLPVSLSPHSLCRNALSEVWRWLLWWPPRALRGSSAMCEMQLQW